MWHDAIEQVSNSGEGEWVGGWVGGQQRLTVPLRPDWLPPKRRRQLARWQPPDCLGRKQLRRQPLARHLQVDLVRVAPDETVILLTLSLHHY